MPNCGMCLCVRVCVCVCNGDGVCNGDVYTPLCDSDMEERREILDRMTERAIVTLVREKLK